MRDTDDFADVPEATGLGGIFAGEGLSDVSKVTTRLDGPNAQTGDPAGLHVFVRCESCGKPPRILVTLPELIVISMGRETPEWYYDGKVGLFRWRLGCSGHEQVRPYPFGLTVDECTRAVQKALSYGYISMPQVKQIQQQVAAQPVAR